MTVSTKEPLLSATQLSNGNFLSITLEAAYSIPEEFAATGPLQNYMACLQVPAAEEVRNSPGMVKGVLAASQWSVLPHYAVWNKAVGCVAPVLVQQQPLLWVLGVSVV